MTAKFTPLQSLSIIMAYSQPFLPSIKQADFKSSPSDFIVKENLTLDFSGHGEHLWLHIEKINLNTEFVAKLLAKWANIPARDVGFSGLKDRHGKTDQWFSLRLPKSQLPSQALSDFVSNKLNDGESLNVLQQIWHLKKLNRSTHKSNDFIVTLKNVVGDKTAIDHQLKHICSTGIPNYFGAQRFGKHGNNLDHAQVFFDKILNSDKPYRPDRYNKDDIYISTARSALFNAILETRVQQNTWRTAITGDVFMLSGTNSIFCSDINNELQNRINQADISPTAVLYGTGEPRHHSESLALQDSIINQEKFSTFKNGLLKINAKLSYRPLCLFIQNLAWQWQDDTLTLSFTLPSGSYATSFLDTICANLIEKSHQ